MADSAWVPSLAAAVSATTDTPRHTVVVRITHWFTALCFLALLVSGIEILISHPRFYWGESGNVMDKPLFSLPIPASRAAVPTGYGYVLADQNGWSRSLHFQAAWGAVLVGLWYFVSGVLTGHFRRHLLPAASDLKWERLAPVLADHLRFRRPPESEAWSYNVLQRLAYLCVIFVLFPLMIWTGLAMSPAVVSAIPALVTSLGGQQSARTIHFFDCGLLAAFLAVHVLMIVLAGFKNRMRAMVTGIAGTRKERP